MLDLGCYDVATLGVGVGVGEGGGGKRTSGKLLVMGASVERVLLE